MQGDPRSERDWEHWPGRKTEDDGIRHRLKALFSATDGDALEELIEEKGREIENQTDRLHATISDLERREERAMQLRTAVEEMLRQGSAELDARHAELTRLAQDLAAREERIRAEERDIAVRKQELGAVELLRAAVERREQAATEREAAIEQRADDLEARHATATARPAAEVVALPGGAARGRAADASQHILVLADGGYRMAERDGPPAPVGAVVEVDGAPFVVVRVGRPPRPGDARAFVYVEPAQG